MESFKQIVAPFDGIVTERNTDVGALISSGSSGRPLFVVSDLHRVRIYVQVPQATRSMQVELQADNSDGKLYGGTYCRVDFQVPGDPNMVRLPATALMPANRGTQVAILGGDGKVALKAIQLGRDFGDTVEVTAGLSPQDQVIDSPPETLQSGDAVEVGPATGSTPKSAGKPNSPATQ